MTPTTTQREADRAAFKEWAKANLLPLTEWEDDHGLYYADAQTYAAWGAWRAAWTASRQAAADDLDIAVKNGELPIQCEDAALPARKDQP